MDLLYHMRKISSYLFVLPSAVTGLTRQTAIETHWQSINFFATFALNESDPHVGWYTLPLRQNYTFVRASVLLIIQRVLIPALWDAARDGVSPVMAAWSLTNQRFFIDLMIHWWWWSLGKCISLFFFCLLFLACVSNLGASKGMMPNGLSMAS